MFHYKWESGNKSLTSCRIWGAVRFEVQWLSNIYICQAYSFQWLNPSNKKELVISSHTDGFHAITTSTIQLTYLQITLYCYPFQSYSHPDLLLANSASIYLVIIYFSLFISYGYEFHHMAKLLHSIIYRTLCVPMYVHIYCHRFQSTILPYIYIYMVLSHETMCLCPTKLIVVLTEWQWEWPWL